MLQCEHGISVRILTSKDKQEQIEKLLQKIMTSKEWQQEDHGQRKREIRNSFGRQKSRTPSTNKSFDSDCRFKNCFDGGAKRRRKK